MCLRDVWGSARKYWGAVYTLKSSEGKKKGLELLSRAGGGTGTSKEVEMEPEVSKKAESTWRDFQRG